MGLTKELTKGQDIEVDVEGNRNFKPLRVVYPSWGPTVVLADKKKYFKEKDEGTEHPNIDVIFLNYRGYELDFKKRIIPSGNTSPENKSSTLIYSEGKYDETLSILEQL